MQNITKVYNNLNNNNNNFNIATNNYNSNDDTNNNNSNDATNNSIPTKKTVIIDPPTCDSSPIKKRKNAKKTSFLPISIIRPLRVEFVKQLSERF